MCLLWHYYTVNKMSLLSLKKQRNKIKHKKKGTNEWEITFEKLSELQLETVALTTLYQ